MDPGAVPGGSTINRSTVSFYVGAETGSTWVIKIWFVSVVIRRYRMIITNANDNVAFVAANDNSVFVGEGKAAA